MVPPDAEEALRLAREASIAGFETAKGDCDDCGICLDAAEEVAIDGCNHMLCSAHRASDDTLCIFIRPAAAPSSQGCLMGDDEGCLACTLERWHLRAQEHADDSTVSSNCFSTANEC